MKDAAPTLPIARGEKGYYHPTAHGNRHGLIAGATGTGKTMTLRVLAEQFSRRRFRLWRTSRIWGLCRPGETTPGKRWIGG